MHGLILIQASKYAGFSTYNSRDLSVHTDKKPQK